MPLGRRMPSEQRVLAQRGAELTGVEALAWLVLAFADGPDCLVQGSFHWGPEGRVFVREDGCAIQSQQEGAQLVLWSNNRWVMVQVPTGTRSLTYRWGRSVAFANGDSVRVQMGKVLPTYTVEQP